MAQNTQKLTLNYHLFNSKTAHQSISAIAKIIPQRPPQFRVQEAPVRVCVLTLAGAR